MNSNYFLNCLNAGGNSLPPHFRSVCDDETVSETNDTFNESIGYGSVTSSSFLTECVEGVSEKTENNIDDTYDDDRDSVLASELSLLALDSPTR